jgi:ribose transport system permease protein
MRFVATFGMLAIGEVFIIITGGIDLSIGSLTALTGVICAWMMLNGLETLGIPPVGMIPAILIALIIGSGPGCGTAFSSPRCASRVHHHPGHLADRPRSGGRHHARLPDRL